MLHGIGDQLRAWLLLIPLDVARIVLAAVPLLLMGWLVWLPVESGSETTSAPVVHNEQYVATLRDASRTARWDEQLKFWAWLALLFQAVVYFIF